MCPIIYQLDHCTHLVAARWQEYFNTLLNRPTQSPPDALVSEAQASTPDSTIDTFPHTTIEVYKAINKIKAGKEAELAWARSRLATCSRLLAVDWVWVEPATSWLRFQYSTNWTTAPTLLLQGGRSTSALYQIGPRSLPLMLWIDTAYSKEYAVSIQITSNTVAVMP